MAIDPDDLLTQYNLACMYSQLGKSGEALDLLERLLPQANHETKAWIRHDADLQPLHSEPRWQQLLELMG
jgi:adenylate cyclase